MSIQLITDHSYRAVQATALESELARFPLKRKVIITCGIDAVNEAVDAKQQGDFLVSIGDPLGTYERFDTLILPDHEPMPQHKNIIPVKGLLNEFSPEKLKDGGGFDEFAKPRVAILLGGKHVGGDVVQADVDTILRGFSGVKLVTTSRRTNKKLKIAADFVYDFNWDGQDGNPYPELLAAADAVVVTADSARMCSEVCSSGKPAYIYTPRETHFSYKALKGSLIAGGYARDFAEISERIKPTKLLQEAKRVAEIIHNQL